MTHELIMDSDKLFNILTSTLHGSFLGASTDTKSLILDTLKIEKFTFVLSSRPGRTDQLSDYWDACITFNNEADMLYFELKYA